MALQKEKKQAVLNNFQRKANDTGSPEVQVALLTERINSLTDHFKVHAKDHHSRFGLIKMVNQRRKLLSYLSKTFPRKYQEVITKLNLRK